jgi:hypothetical protein
VSELYRPSDSRLSVKLVPTFADRMCHVVSVTDPCARILGFLDRLQGAYARQNDTLQVKKNRYEQTHRNKGKNSICKERN